MLLLLVVVVVTVAAAAVVVVVVVVVVVIVVVVAIPTDRVYIEKKQSTFVFSFPWKGSVSLSFAYSSLSERNALLCSVYTKVQRTIEDII